VCVSWDISHIKVGQAKAKAKAQRKKRILRATFAACRLMAYDGHGNDDGEC